MIKVGDELPDGTLFEYNEIESAGCAIGPQPIAVKAATVGRTIAIFGLPGAFTPTCSARHAPGYVAHAAALHAKGIDEIWCVSVNDAFVMGAWARDLHAQGKVRMLGDGSGLYTKALGLELDLIERGMGVRMQRCSLVVNNGRVTHFNLEQPGKFEVSDAETMLQQV